MTTYPHRCIYSKTSVVSKDEWGYPTQATSYTVNTDCRFYTVNSDTDYSLFQRESGSRTQYSQYIMLPPSVKQPTAGDKIEPVVNGSLKKSYTVEMCKTVFAVIGGEVHHYECLLEA